MAGLSEIVATTREYRETTVGDAVSDNTPLYFKLRELGRILTIPGGREIYENFRFAQNGYVQTIDATQEITLGYNQTITGFQYSPKLVISVVMINELERAQNQGPGQFKNLLKERMEVSDASLVNKMETMAQGDGSGNGGKDLAGIKAYITRTDTGTIGGISRVTVSAVRNVHVDLPSVFTGATTAANIESRVRVVKNQLVRGTAKRFMLLGADFFNYACDAASAKQRFTTDPKMAELGFETVIIEGMTAVLANGRVPSGLARIGAKEGFILNPETFGLKMYQGYNLEALPERVSGNQLVDVSLTLGIGNLTCNDPGANAVIWDA